MGRVTASRKKEIGVGLVECDPLAAKYLRGVLAKDRSVKLLAAGPLRRNRKQCDLPEVIVAAWDPCSRTAGLLRTLRRSAPKARILILGSRLAPDTIVSLLRAGAHGFVDIEEVETDLLPAIRSRSGGRAWRRLEGFKVAPPGAIREAWFGNSEPRFTPREAAVVALVRQGLLNKQVASELAITERTVKFHLRDIFVKLGISDRRLIADSVLAAAAPQVITRQPSAAAQVAGRTSARR